MTIIRTVSELRDMYARSASEAEAARERELEVITRRDAYNGELAGATAQRVARQAERVEVFTALYEAKKAASR